MSGRPTPDEQLTSYDEFPYDSHAFAQSHPDRLATVATLLGMNVAPVERCRVLELGCASGGNLIPMAATLPASAFVGIDLSQRQIAAGQEVVEALRMENIRLERMDILDVTARFGQFDYIIAHGVFSWVAVEVQDKILEICAQNLAPNGVAYVSYNTYPGWHMRTTIRDMMCYHARQFSDPHMQVRQARNLLSFMAKSLAKDNSPYSQLLQSELQLVRQSKDYYLFHEHLEGVNDPIYFHEFIERAAANRLDYLGEADLRVMLPSNFPPEVESVLQVLSADIVHLEQYMDFLRNRMFRQTLLRHRSIPISYRLRSERLDPFWVASPVKPATADPDLHAVGYKRFEAPDGAALSVDQPLAKAALVHLSEIWPRSITVAELRRAARQRLNLPPAEDPSVVAQEIQVLGVCLLTAYTSPSTRLVELHVSAPRHACHVGPRPRASVLARFQAARSPLVTSLRHRSIVLGDIERRVLQQLDGQHDREALLDGLVRAAEAGEINLNGHDEPTSTSSSLRAVVELRLDDALAHLAREALLLT